MIDFTEANAVLEENELPSLRSQGRLYASYGVEFGVQVDPEAEMADVVYSASGEPVRDELTGLGLAQAAQIAALMNRREGPWVDSIRPGADSG